MLATSWVLSQTQKSSETRCVPKQAGACEARAWNTEYFMPSGHERKDTFVRIEQRGGRVYRIIRAARRNRKKSIIAIETCRIISIALSKQDCDILL